MTPGPSTARVPDPGARDRPPPALLVPERVALAAGAIVAFALRMWCHAERATLGTYTQFADTLYYLDRMEAIRSAGLVPQHAFFMSPLYPYLLAATVRPGSAHPFLLVAIVQSVLAVTALVLLALAARRIAGRVAGIATMALGALAGPWVLYDTSLLPDGPATALQGIGVGLFMLVPARRPVPGCAAAGAALALAAGLRSNIVLTTILLAGWLLLEQRRKRARPWVAMTAFLAPTLAVLATLSAVNLAAEGLAAPVSYNSGLNLFVGNNAHATGVYTDLGGRIHSLDDPRGRAEPERELGRTLSSSEIDDYWRAQAIDFIAGDPGGAVRLFGRKLALFWAPGEIPQLEHFTLARLESHALNISRVGFDALLALAIVGLLCLDRDRWRDAMPLVLTLSAAVVTCVLFFVNGRLRLPAWTALVPLAGCGVAGLAKLVERRSARAFAVPVLAGALGALLPHAIALPPFEELTPAHSAVRYALTEAVYGNEAAARRWIDLEPTLRGDEPPSPRHRLRRGAALSRLRDYEEAFDELVQAADALPDHPRAQEGLIAVGTRLVEQGRAGPEVHAAIARARSRLVSAGR